MASDLNVDTLQAALTTALKSYHQHEVEAGLFAEMLVFQQIRQRCDSDREALRTLLQDGLNRLAAQQTQRAKLVERRLIEQEKLQIVANSLGISPSTVHRWQAEALRQLALIVHSQETRTRQNQQVVWQQRLERPAYTELIGIEAI